MPTIEELDSIPGTEAADIPAPEAPTPSVVDEILSKDPTAKSAKRSESVSQTREQKLDALFAGKQFDIVREVHLEKGQVFQTPLGNKGRNGFVLRNKATGEEFVIGATTLAIAAKTYNAVVLPEPPVKEKKVKAPKPDADAVVDPTAAA